MEEPRQQRPENPNVFVYRGALPIGVLLLVGLPLLFVFLSMAAVALAAGTAAALVLPWLWRRRPAVSRNDDAIELDRSQYTHVGSDRRPLPPR